jgi:hypothetical protein
MPVYTTSRKGIASMNNKETDKGIIALLIKKFEEEMLPRALDIQKRLDIGEFLTEADFIFLERALENSDEISRLAQKHPEYQKLYSQRTSLCKEITEKAIENEKNRG